MKKLEFTPIEDGFANIQFWEAPYRDGCLVMAKTASNSIALVYVPNGKAKPGRPAKNQKTVKTNE